MFLFKNMKQNRLPFEGEQLYILYYNRTSLRISEVSFYAVVSFTPVGIRFVLSDKSCSTSFNDNQRFLCS